MSAQHNDIQRRLAVDLFNEVWTLLRRSDRTPADDDRMLHAAHASRYHWGEVGTAVNAARGEWQCSRVYAVLGRAEPALHHARRCLELTEAAHEREDFDLPFAFEALARAHAVAGFPEEADRWCTMARAAAELIADPEDRELVFSDLATVPCR